MPDLPFGAFNWNSVNLLRLSVRMARALPYQTVPIPSAKLISNRNELLRIEIAFPKML
jgi:hypothetical protein